MNTPLLTLLSTLIATSAFAEGGHFTIPSGAPSAVANPVVNGFVNDMNPPSCQNKAALLSHFQAYRQKARLGYAQAITKMIPQIIPGTKCINSKEAFDTRYEKNGDYFVLTCLAEKGGKLTHLYKMELMVDTPMCLTDQIFNNFINSPECQRDQGAALRYQNTVLGNCNMLQPGQMPKLRGSNAAYPINGEDLARLINDRPSVQNIIDTKDFRVKIGRTDSPGSSSGDSGCNQGGCLPGFGAPAR